VTDSEVKYLFAIFSFFHKTGKRRFALRRAPLPQTPQAFLTVLPSADK
jgi:hypothetical protein